MWGWRLAGQPIHLLAPEAIWLQAAPACLHCHRLTYLSSLFSSSIEMSLNMNHS